MRNQLKQAIREAGVLLAIASIIGFLFNHFSERGIPLIASPISMSQASDSTIAVAADSLAPSPSGFEEPVMLTLAQAFQLFTSKHVAFVDARKSDLYALGHIKGAISLPWLGPEAPAKIPESLPTIQPLIVYCEDRECDSAAELAYFLFDQQYFRVYVFQGGWEEWSAANYPSEKQ